MVDHLVTFIACEIVTGGGLTKILGSHPAGIRQGRPDACAPVRRFDKRPRGLLKSINHTAEMKIGGDQP
jgi:hypothetical protein